MKDTKIVSLAMSTALFEAVRQFAFGNHLSLSAAVRFILAERLKDIMRVGD